LFLSCQNTEKQTKCPQLFLKRACEFRVSALNFRYKKKFDGIRICRQNAMKTISENLLQEITRRLVAELKPEKVILFGSHAWGKPTDDSDLDLLVIVPESNEPPTKRATRAYRSLIGMGVPKDILVYTRAEVDRHSRVYASLISEVLERGRVLYG
jgi:predicted nucleotidyltransferase